MHRLLVAFLLLFSFVPSVQADLRLATWNIYWLGDGNGNDRNPRTELDYAKLAAYARQLDADIIAVQEVENEDALSKIFPPGDYTVIMSSRNNTQRTGFVLKNTVNYIHLGDYEDLNVSGGLRYGTVIDVNYGGKEIAIMAVHLKSGCFDKDLDNPTGDACNKLSRQVGPLISWIEDQKRSGRTFALLGDFNRRMDVQGDDLWREIAKTGARRIGVGQKPKCHGGKYGEYIDHMIVGPELAPMIKTGSFDELTFTEGFSQHKKLSDHCPLSFELN